MKARLPSGSGIDPAGRSVGTGGGFNQALDPLGGIDRRRHTADLTWRRADLGPRWDLEVQASAAEAGAALIGALGTGSPLDVEVRGVARIDTGYGTVAYEFDGSESIRPGR